MTFLDLVLSEQAGNLARVIGTPIIVIQFFIFIKETERKIKFDRNKSTLDYLQQVNESHNKLRRWLLSFEGDLGKVDDLRDEDRANVVSYLRIMERLSVGVKYGVYGYPIVNDLISTSSRENYVRLKKYIYAVQHDGPNANKNRWIEFEALCIRLEKSSRKSIIGKSPT
jgi:hypothetical protein